MDRSVVSLLSKPVGVRAVSQRLIPTGEQSELQTRIAPTEDPPLYASKKAASAWASQSRGIIGVTTRLQMIHSCLVSVYKPKE